MTSSSHRNLTKREQTLIGRRRLMQGPILAMREQMVDADGGIGAPLIALSTLAIMERHGTITAEQRVVGERFHALFRLASLDGLKAAPMDRVSGGGNPERHNGNERARREINDAMRHLGQTSILGSCAWHVLGLEWTLTEWAKTATRGNTHQAGGVTIATLSILDAHFR